MSDKISRTSRNYLLLASVFVLLSIFLPWWGMKFYAPQYPEGLNIIVYPYKLAGEIDIVNGLNHYIGMAEFSEESFPELQYLPYIIAGLALITIFVALLRNKKLVYSLLGIFIVAGGVGIYDIKRWLTKFGTDLDPKAPIELAPFVPPIIGENTIANFITHSYFTYGSFALGIGFLFMVYPLWRERKQ